MTPTERIDRLIYMYENTDSEFLIKELKKIRKEFELSKDVKLFGFDNVVNDLNEITIYEF